MFRFSLYQRIENDRRVWHRDQSVCLYGSFVDYPDLWHGDRFFRFANDKEEKEPQRVYTTGLISLATTSTLFFVLVWVFITPLSRLLGYPEHEDYVLMMAAIIAVDAFTALPFAYLRYRHRPIRFASIKLFSIFLNIALNLFFILLCPWLYGIHPEWISWFFDPDFWWDIYWSRMSSVRELYCWFCSQRFSGYVIGSTGICCHAC